MSVEATLWAWKLDKTQVSPTEKLIMLSMADRANEDFQCWPSKERLEKDTLLSRKTIFKLMNSLCQKGLIKDTGERKGKQKRVVVYELIGVTKRECNSSKTTTIETENSEVNSSKSTTINSGSFTTQNLKEEPNKNNITIEPYVEAWNLASPTCAIKKVGMDKKDWRKIKRNLQIIQEKWEVVLTPESFTAWLHSAIMKKYYMLTNYESRMDVCLRWEHFSPAWELIKTGN